MSVALPSFCFPLRSHYSSVPTHLEASMTGTITRVSGLLAPVDFDDRVRNLTVVEDEAGERAAWDETDGTLYEIDMGTIGDEPEAEE
jgi:hypothetical protein